MPGLFGFVRGVEEAGCLPTVPLLETLLARARYQRTGGADLAATLFDLFGVTADKGKDLPSAALCRLGDGAEPDSEYWLHADPVFLKPDGDRLLLFDAAHLEIRKQDADGLLPGCPKTIALVS